jgi:hypothetical protein
MPSSKITLFSQVLQLIDRVSFRKIVNKYQSDKHSKGITSWTHLVSMLFMQMSDCHSLRDISMGLRSATGNLQHMGVQKAPSKSSISYINKSRGYEVFRDLYFALLEKYEPSLQRRKKYARKLKRKLFVMDSSVIPLCLSLFDWAKYRTKKGAIKLHAVLDYDTGLPCYASLSDGKRHDIKEARDVVFPAGSVLAVDRAYIDFEWLNNLDSSGVIFVSKLKTNISYEIVKEHPVNDKGKDILNDYEIELTGVNTSKAYPKRLRAVHVYDEKNEKYLVLVTNQFSWTADTISQVYKARWAIETFFKHIKQLFRVKTFVGTSPNAVRIQMWCAMIAILLLKYLRQRGKYPWGLSNLITFMRTNLFVKIDLWKWIDHPIDETKNLPPPGLLFS